MKASQDTVHESLERGRGIAQPKWHQIKLKESVRGANGCLLPVLRLHFHLPVLTQQIEGAKDSRSSKRVQSLVNSGNGIRILS